MNAEISERTKNPLLGREEISLVVKDAKETPSRKDLRKKISALVGANEELVVVGKIEHHFGSKQLSCRARVYESKGKMDSVEAKFIIDRNLGVKKGEKEEPKEETPVPAGEAEKAEGKTEKTEDGKAEKTEEKEPVPEEKGAGKEETAKNEGEKKE